MNRIELLNKINESDESDVIGLAELVLISHRQLRQLEKYNAGEIPFSRIRDMVTTIANSVDYPPTMFPPEIRAQFEIWHTGQTGK